MSSVRAGFLKNGFQLAEVLGPWDASKLYNACLKYRKYKDIGSAAMMIAANARVNKCNVLIPQTPRELENFLRGMLYSFQDSGKCFIA